MSPLIADKLIQSVFAGYYKKYESVFGLLDIITQLAGKQWAFVQQGWPPQTGRPFPLARGTAEAAPSAAEVLDFVCYFTLAYEAHLFDIAVTAYSLVISVEVAQFTVL